MFILLTNKKDEEVLINTDGIECVIPDPYDERFSRLFFVHGAVEEYMLIKETPQEVGIAIFKQMKAEAVLGQPHFLDDYIKYERVD